MKIDPKTRNRDLAQHVIEHLTFLPVVDTKVMIMGSLLGFLDLPLGVAFSLILNMKLLWFMLPFLLFIHLWGIRLLFKNRYSVQFETLLFIGVFGAISACLLYVAFIAMFYFGLGVTNVYIYAIIIAINTLSAFILVIYQVKKFSTDPTVERKERKPSKYWWVLNEAPGFGYLISVLTRENPTASLVIMIFCVYYFYIFCAYLGAKFLHRYFYMRENIDFAKYQPIGRKKKKKLAKQGVEIK